MIGTARNITGWAAVSAYMMVGAILYFRVLPGAQWHWPPDFYLRGYDATSIAPFLDAMGMRAQSGYTRVLEFYDRVFVVLLAFWLAFMGWRGSRIRYVIAVLAATYAIVDLGENAAILRILNGELEVVRMAHALTMAKFASFYLCALALLMHLRWGPR